MYDIGFTMNFENLQHFSVFHDFFSQFGSTKLYVSKKHEGHGLVCHRAIKCACEVIGIKDLHVKVEGAMNYQSIVKAFLIGLLQQVVITSQSNFHVINENKIK